MRAEYDHQGLDDRRATAHDNRLLYPGMRDRNKRPVQMFPFDFQPMSGGRSRALLSHTACRTQPPREPPLTGCHVRIV